MPFHQRLVPFCRIPSFTSATPLSSAAVPVIVTGRESAALFAGAVIVPVGVAASSAVMRTENWRDPGVASWLPAASRALAVTR